MRRSSSIAVAVLAMAFCASPAGAAWNPGAFLDRPDLDGLFISANRLGGGSYAYVKGVKNPDTFGLSWISGAIAGGDPYRSAGPWNAGSTPATGYLSSTLMPPFAMGTVFHITGTSPYRGTFVQALLYQPDQVKRTAGNNAEKLLLKQKAYVQFRVGDFSGLSSTPLASVLEPDCKAQANFSETSTPNLFKRVYKFKVSCKSPEQQVREALEGVFGKQRKGYSLSRTLAKKKAK